MNNQIETHVQNANWMNKIEFMLKSGRAYAQPLVFQEPESEAMLIESCFSLERNEAQKLMDQLWVCGLRPTEGTGSAGSLKATENHLSDMRKIVFKYVELDDK